MERLSSYYDTKGYDDDAESYDYTEGPEGSEGPSDRLGASDCSFFA